MWQIFAFIKRRLGSQWQCCTCIRGQPLTLLLMFVLVLVSCLDFSVAWHCTFNLSLKEKENKKKKKLNNWWNANLYHDIAQSLEQVNDFDHQNIYPHEERLMEVTAPYPTPAPPSLNLMEGFVKTQISKWAEAETGDEQRVQDPECWLVLDNSQASKATTTSTLQLFTTELC